MDDVAAQSEAARVVAVQRYGILGTAPNGAFDRVAALAARLLDAPIATVTIVDSDRIWFKARHGLAGVTRVDREPGLCASAITQDDVYIVKDALTDPRTARNSLVHGELGVRFYAAAPLVTSDGYRLGTLNIIDTTPREGLDATGAQTLRDLAAVVMDALELRRGALATLRWEHELREQAQRDLSELDVFASTLQRTLIPPKLPRIPGVELASHYSTASTRQVGGDFYDVFDLEDGSWAVALGDVSGKGAPAAALTSLVRYSIRALAVHEPRPDPSQILTGLNEVMLNDQANSEWPRFCTCLLGVLHPENHRSRRPFQSGLQLTLASGGHPPPYLIRAGSGTQTIDLSGGMLLGAVDKAVIRSTSVRLFPGDGLLFYTDGLTEAPTASGHRVGTKPLLDRLNLQRDTRAAALISSAVDVLDEHGTNPTDDVTLLALSVPRTKAPGSRQRARTGTRSMTRRRRQRR